MFQLQITDNKQKKFLNKLINIKKNMSNLYKSRADSLVTACSKY